MNVGTVHDSRVQLQSPSVAAGVMNKTAQNLHKTTPVSSDAMEALDHVIGAMENGRSLEMYYDKDINRIVVQVVDEQTRKVVFQIPPEGLVDSMKSFKNYLKATKEGV